jgi:hypothetical protein
MAQVSVWSAEPLFEPMHAVGFGDLRVAEANGFRLPRESMRKNQEFWLRDCRILTARQSPARPTRTAPVEKRRAFDARS